jgi:hypothetical protein
MERSERSERRAGWRPEGASATGATPSSAERSERLGEEG